MSKSQIFGVIRLLVASGAVLLSVGCAVSTAKQEEAAGSSTAALKGGASTGFVCGQSIDGTIGCVCDMSSSDPIMSCGGMMTVCDLIGPGMTCDMDGICGCIAWGTRPGGKGEAADPTAGLDQLESLGIQAQVDMPKGIFEGALGDSIDGSTEPGVAALDNTDGQMFACITKCQTPDSITKYCYWLCDCMINKKKDRITCESEDPYIDIRETPPPPPLKELDLGTGFSP